MPKALLATLTLLTTTSVALAVSDPYAYGLLNLPQAKGPGKTVDQLFDSMEIHNAVLSYKDSFELAFKFGMDFNVFYPGECAASKAPAADLAGDVVKYLSAFEKRYGKRFPAFVKAARKADINLIAFMDSCNRLNKVSLEEQTRANYAAVLRLMNGTH